MSEEIFSLIITCRADLAAQTIHVQVVNVDTGEPLPGRDGTFLLRITLDSKMLVVRCLLRHTASGEEVHLQSGPNLLALLQAHLLSTDMNKQAGIEAEEMSLYQAIEAEKTIADSETGTEENSLDGGE